MTNPLNYTAETLGTSGDPAVVLVRLVHLQSHLSLEVKYENNIMYLMSKLSHPSEKFFAILIEQKNYK